MLLLTGDHDDVLYRSGRNLPKLTVKPATNASTLDLMQAQVILLQEGALDALSTALGKKAPATAEPQTDAEPEAETAAAE